MIFDTHAHYDSRQFDEDRVEVLSRIHRSDGFQYGGVPVGRIVNVGADMESSQTTLELAEKYDYIYAAVGVHPDSAGELVWCPAGASIDGEERKVIPKETVLENREVLKNLAKTERTVAIGEIGLDYHWDIWPREIQKEAFRWQWGLAEELGLSVIIHSRDAAEDTLNLVREFYGISVSARTIGMDSIEEDIRRNQDKRRVQAVMHCYSYSPEHAAEYLKMGLMFGIGGVVTFKNAKKLKEVVDLLPLDRILLETDCPYMAPDPFRGKRNDSGFLTYVAEKIAEIKGVDARTVYDITWENAERFFGLRQD